VTSFALKKVIPSQIIASEKSKRHKRRFDALLRHIKIILLEYRTTLPYPEWLKLVSDTKESIKHHREEYLGEEAALVDAADDVIELVFSGFLHDIRIREIQAFRNAPSLPHD
jgi:hypothetical protein